MFAAAAAAVDAKVFDNSKLSLRINIRKISIHGHISGFGSFWTTTNIERKKKQTQNRLFVAVYCLTVWSCRSIIAWKISIHQFDFFFLFLCSFCCNQHPYKKSKLYIKTIYSNSRVGRCVFACKWIQHTRKE